MAVPRKIFAAALLLGALMIAALLQSSALPILGPQLQSSLADAAPKVADFSAHSRSAAEFAQTSPPIDSRADPLLTEGLRDTLEALLLEAGQANDPVELKLRLAGLLGKHFPAEITARAEALAQRYVDFRVALAELRGPQVPGKPQALRNALQARNAIRARFFAAAEYAALFARTDELDRYTLARFEVIHNRELSAEQRAQALQAAEKELSTEHLAQRKACIEHLAAAEQTAIFNAHHADTATRFAARSAQYGEAAAQALAALDQQEQHWQQRLARYSQALIEHGEHSPAVQQLRSQIFLTEELQRVDAALELRRLQVAAASS